MNKICQFCLIFLLGGLSLSQLRLSPQAIATAQTFGTFSGGVEALSWNPALLAYGRENADTIITSKIISRELTGIRIQLFATANKIKADSLKSHLDSLILETTYVIEEDSIFKVRVGNFLFPENADSFKIQLTQFGYDSTWTVNTNIEVPVTVISTEIIPRKPAFSMELFNLGFQFGNSAITPEWYNNYFQPSSVYLYEKNKTEFLNPFGDRWQISPIAQLQFGINVKNFGFFIRPEINGEAFLPKSLLKFLLYGNRFGQEINLSNLSTQMQTVIPIGFAYGSKLNIPGLPVFIQSIYAGLNAKYLIGLAYFETSTEYTEFLTQEENLSGKGTIISRYSLMGAHFDPVADSLFQYEITSDELSPGGSGIAIDLGFLVDIDDHWRGSLAITNLFGKINWKNKTTYQHELHYNFNVSTEKIDSLMSHFSEEEKESFIQDSLGIVEKNIAIKTFSTNYPGSLRLGAEYSVPGKINAAINLQFGFSNEFGSSKTPLLSMGVEYPVLNWLNLRSGTAFGGTESFRWGFGFLLDFNHYQCDFGFGQTGGIFNKAKGFGLAFSNSILF